MRPDIPTFLWQIGTGVENLIQQHDALEHWRDHVRRWSTEETSPTDLIKVLYSRSLDAKYALLAAIHDLCFDSDQALPINPWPDDLPLEAAKEGISYLILKMHLLPDAQAFHRGLDASESDRLQIIVGDIVRTLPPKSLGREGAGDSRADAVAPILSPEFSRRLNELSLSVFKVAWCCDATKDHQSREEARDFLLALGQISEALKWATSVSEQLPQCVRNELRPLAQIDRDCGLAVTSLPDAGAFWASHCQDLYQISERLRTAVKLSDERKLNPYPGLLPPADLGTNGVEHFLVAALSPVFDERGRLVGASNPHATLSPPVKPKRSAGNGGADPTSMPQSASTKGEIMASLQDERLASLYRQFLRAAEQFPFVRFAAVRRSDGQGQVSADEWCGLLGAPKGCSHIGRAALVLIDEELWEAGCYLTHGDYDPSPECIARINIVVAEVERLSRTAGSCFGFRPPPSQPPQPQLGIEWEWLRTMLRMSFVHKWDHLGLSVRELPEDFFTASARTIEELTARQTLPPTSTVERDDRSGTTALRRESESTRPDAVVGSQAQGKRFRVALSFPGEHRPFVAQVADVLAGRLERRRVFYDNYYEAELARPNLDTYLQRIYHDDSDLIAVFLCAEYEKKGWCGLEWRAIREQIKKRAGAAIMPFRFDATTIPGLFSIDGYVEIGKRSPSEVASLILERLEHNDHCNARA